MEPTNVALIALGIFALLVLGFFAVFRGTGKFSIRTKLGSATAEGTNPPPPAAVQSGVILKGIDSGGKVTAASSADGGVSVEDVRATGNVSANHTPGTPPPKT